MDFSKLFPKKTKIKGNPNQIQEINIDLGEIGKHPNDIINYAYLKNQKINIELIENISTATKKYKIECKKKKVVEEIKTKNKKFSLKEISEMLNKNLRNDYLDTEKNDNQTNDSEENTFSVDKKLVKLYELFNKFHNKEVANFLTKTEILKKRSSDLIENELKANEDNRIKKVMENIFNLEGVEKKLKSKRLERLKALKKQLQDKIFNKKNIDSKLKKYIQDKVLFYPEDIKESSIKNNINEVFLKGDKKYLLEKKKFPRVEFVSSSESDIDLNDMYTKNPRLNIKKKTICKSNRNLVNFDVNQSFENLNNWDSCNQKQNYEKNDNNQTHDPNTKKHKQRNSMYKVQRFESINFNYMQNHLIEIEQQINNNNILLKIPFQTNEKLQENQDSKNNSKYGIKKKYDNEIEEDITNNLNNECNNNKTNLRVINGLNNKQGQEDENSLETNKLNFNKTFFPAKLKNSSRNNLKCSGNETSNNFKYSFPVKTDIMDNVFLSPKRERKEIKINNISKPTSLTFSPLSDKNFSNSKDFKSNTHKSNLDINFDFTNGMTSLDKNLKPSNNSKENNNIINNKNIKNPIAIKKGIDSINNEVNEEQLFAYVKDKTKFTKGDFINYKENMPFKTMQEFFRNTSINQNNNIEEKTAFNNNHNFVGKTNCFNEKIKFITNSNNENKLKKEKFDFHTESRFTDIGNKKHFFKPNATSYNDFRKSQGKDFLFRTDFSRNLDVPEIKKLNSNNGDILSRKISLIAQNLPQKLILKSDNLLFEKKKGLKDIKKNCKKIY